MPYILRLNELKKQEEKATSYSGIPSSVVSALHSIWQVNTQLTYLLLHRKPLNALTLLILNGSMFFGCMPIRSG